MSRQSEKERLIKLDRRLAEIASWLSPSRLINPTMRARQTALQQLRQALKHGTLCDPELGYLPLPDAVIERSHTALDALKFGQTEVDVLLEEQARSLRNQLELLCARGTKRYGEIAAEMYGLPDEDLRDLAEAILRDELDGLDDLREDEAENEDYLGAEEMAGEMRAALDEMRIHDWDVIILEEMSARMSVSARHREVRIKTDSLFTRRDRDRLIVHELGVHVRRACNGFETGLVNLGLGLQGYISTEEGLASHMERKHNLLERSHVKMYAYRALGAYYAHHTGFAETFRRIVELGASPGIAWDVTLRVKRGLVDTSQPGCFPKDYVYLHGHRIVTEYLAGGGTETDLFLGKIAIEQIPLVSSILESWQFEPVSPSTR